MEEKGFFSKLTIKISFQNGFYSSKNDNKIDEQKTFIFVCVKNCAVTHLRLSNYFRFRIEKSNLQCFSDLFFKLWDPPYLAFNPQPIETFF